MAKYKYGVYNLLANYMPSLNKCMILTNQIDFGFGLFLVQAFQKQNLQHFKCLPLEKLLPGKCYVNSSIMSFARAAFAAGHLNIVKFEPGKTTSIQESLDSNNHDCSKGARKCLAQNAAILIGGLPRIFRFLASYLIKSLLVKIITKNS